MNIPDIVDILRQAALYLSPIAGTTLIKKGVEDAYTKAKTFLGKKSKNSQDALAQVEAEPESKGYALVLEEQLAKLDIAEDAEFIAILRTLHSAMKEAQLAVPEAIFDNFDGGKGKVVIDNQQKGASRVRATGIKAGEGIEFRNKQEK